MYFLTLRLYLLILWVCSLSVFDFDGLLLSLLMNRESLMTYGSRVLFEFDRSSLVFEVLAANVFDKFTASFLQSWMFVTDTYD